MKNLAQAIINVMKSVNGVGKNADIGTGKNTYKGIKDIDVKNAYKEAMELNGLCILPIGIEDEVKVSRWEVDGSYGKTQKQSVFAKVITKYLLLHTSGESQEIMGYGHGVDSGDKAAGKATTYAMKYALLYTFLTPTGQIDDSDTIHSGDQEIPKQGKAPEKQAAKKVKQPEGKKGFGVNELASNVNRVQKSLDQGQTHDQVIAKIEETFGKIEQPTLNAIKKMKPNAKTA